MKKALTLLLLLPFLLCSSCLVPKSAVTYVIGVSISNNGDIFETRLIEELKRSALLYDNTRIFFVDANNNIGKQYTDIEDIIHYGADVLIVVPVDYNAVRAQLLGSSARPPVIVLDAYAHSNDFEGLITIDTSKIGKQVGQILVPSVSRPEDVILEVFDPTEQKISPQVSEGILYTLQKCVGFRPQIIAMRSTDWEYLQDDIQRMFVRFPGITAIIAHNPTISNEVSSALKTMEKSDVNLVCIDYGSPDDNVQDRESFANATIYMPCGGDAAIQLAMDILRGSNAVSRTQLL